jgi:hypothetical protein
MQEDQPPQLEVLKDEELVEETSAILQARIATSM